MLHFKKGSVPQLPFLRAVKKPMPVRCIQIHEAFEVETLEGTFTGKAGDYLIIGVEGEMYPCEQGIFEKTYELVKEQ